MWKNYFKVAWRNVLRNKSFSFINIFGLSIGMTCCMLLWLYIHSEASYDTHHQDADNLYLVNSEAIASGNKEEYPMLSAPYAEAIKAEFPEVDQVTRMMAAPIESNILLQVREEDKPLQSFYETKGYHVDTTFFDVFSYHFVEGNGSTALSDPHSIVLSDAVAFKIFGNTPALNKIIRINSATGLGEDFKVTGVYRDESKRSHLDARFFVPITAGWVGIFLRNQNQNFSSNNIFYTYLRLHPGADPANLNQKFSAFMEKYARNDLKVAGFDKRVFLIPVSGLHLYDTLPTIITPTSSRSYLYILASIALFTLLIACINFMNLSTARSTKRAVEVGIRKVMGADRKVLIRQFLGESMIMSLLALVPALLLFSMLLPVFNQLTGKALSISALFKPEIILVFIFLLLITGFLAGSYPAFYLSVFNPVKVLKGRFVNSVSAVTLRRGLVIFQFVISIGLVSATVIIHEQMEFIRNKPLGFTSDQQIIIPLLSEDARKTYGVFRNEILQNNQIDAAAGSMYYPGIYNPSSLSLYRPDQTVDNIQAITFNQVDSYFLDQMGFEVVKGRGFSPAFPADTSNRMVVNEATLKAFEIPMEMAIGQRLNFDWQGVTHSFEIIGVVKDFHFEDLHHQIQPYAFLLHNQPDFNYITTTTHVNSAHVGDALAFLEQKWKYLNPNEPFEYSFLKDDFQKNHLAEDRISRIIGSFTIISIIISCMGLFGLAAFAAQQRTKEIGIRKVLGASATGVITMLSQDFIKLILIAIIIASPLAWYAMNRWLQVFAYRINVSWWMFIISGVLALTVALVTVNFQFIKAALMNPVKSLRSE